MYQGKGKLLRYGANAGYINYRLVHERDDVMASPVPPKQFPAPLAAFACKAQESLGRLYDEPESRHRTAFQRDRDRVVHSVGFRRLMHKTQVFVSHEGDHYRTRLTHSLEVAQVTRSLARMLQLDEDLAEAIALAHDLGHPPFGHTGEDVLQACMADFAGFDHNAQTLRLLTKLERRHAGFDGLNLTWETLEGVVKHNGPLTGPIADQIARERNKPAASLPAAIVEYSKRQDLRLDSFASVEAQIAALADDIAYNNHDTDDGLRAGLFSIDEAMAVPIFATWFERAREDHPSVAPDRLIAVTVSGMIGDMVEDVYAETTKRLAALAPVTADAVRGHSAPVVAFSESMAAQVQQLRDFLWQRMYRHYKVNRARSHARRIVRELFELFFQEPDTLPPLWRSKFDDNKDEARKARAVCDYIAGMTDRYAITEHQKLFGAANWL